MAKSPYTPAFRAKIAEEYLEERDSSYFLANKYGTANAKMQNSQVNGHIL